MTDEEKRVKVIAGMEWALENMVDPMNDFRFSGYDGPAVLMNVPIIQDAIELLKAQEPADSIPIDWLMNYAQLPTEFAISAWRKPKKEAEIKQAKSLDKSMSLDDALELLEAQTPRVLRVEEVVLLKQNDVVWLEDYNKKDVIPAIVSRMGAMVICIEFALSDRFISVGYDDYGKRWRCWTSRPTDEQREAIPWPRRCLARLYYQRTRQSLVCNLWHDLLYGIVP